MSLGDFVIDRDEVASGNLTAADIKHEMDKQTTLPQDQWTAQRFVWAMVHLKDADGVHVFSEPYIKSRLQAFTPTTQLMMISKAKGKTPGPEYDNNTLAAMIRLLRDAGVKI